MHKFELGDVVIHTNGNIYKVIGQFVDRQRNVYDLALVDKIDLAGTIHLVQSDVYISEESMLCLYISSKDVKGRMYNDYYV